MDINSDLCCLDRFESLHLYRFANPLTFPVHSQCIHTVTLILLSPFCTLCCVQLPSHHIFHWAQISVCREANLGYVTQYGLVPPLCSTPALCFPRPLLKHTEKKARGWSEHDDGTCHPPRVSCTNTVKSSPANPRLTVS